ncbi:RNA-binding protein 45-like isoform X2 [Elgaria multicarinata webbii]|uniref:RNA-binding protein 45-like isoform X2 n=1 Tax=Elgaria multicarinata webbii TaxID=159646 RepID=UPI002FCD47FF
MAAKDRKPSTERDRHGGSKSSFLSQDFDNPPRSCLFVQLGMEVPKEKVRERFAPFGEIQDMWMLRDKRTQKLSGAALIKYARSSQACRAWEALNGQCFSRSVTKPMKVLLAEKQTPGSLQYAYKEPSTRIRIHIPKSFTEENLWDMFKVYGEIIFCIIERSKFFRHNKGLAYIKFTKASEAASAIEGCDKSFKAAWAEDEDKTDSTAPSEQESCVNGPKQNYDEQGSSLNTLGVKNLSPSKPPEYYENDCHVSSTNEETNSHEVKRNSMYISEPTSLERTDTRSHEFVSRRLSVVSQSPFVQKQLFSLFNLIPGLESCETHQDPHSNCGYAVIQYTTTAAAIYAKKKLHGFEYPFGNRLLITFIEDGTDGTDLAKEIATQLLSSQLSSKTWNKNSALQLLGSSSSNPPPQLQTDAELPSSKRKAPPDSSVRERLFVMFSPHPLPEDILDNVLSRFGNFINIYLIPGENMGYATFADRASASNAIAMLHGKTVNGVKLKVMLADLPTENSNKHQRIF